jgi:hypothetical protein
MMDSASGRSADSGRSWVTARRVDEGGCHESEREVRETAHDLPLVLCSPSLQAVYAIPASCPCVAWHGCDQPASQPGLTVSHARAPAHTHTHTHTHTCRQQQQIRVKAVQVTAHSSAAGHVLSSTKQGCEVAQQAVTSAGGRAVRPQRRSAAAVACMQLQASHSQQCRADQLAVRGSPHSQQGNGSPGLMRVLVQVGVVGGAVPMVAHGRLHILRAQHHRAAGRCVRFGPTGSKGHMRPSRQQQQ